MFLLEVKNYAFFLTLAKDTAAYIWINKQKQSSTKLAAGASIF
jgi:hypothetical protein